MVGSIPYNYCGLLPHRCWRCQSDCRNHTEHGLISRLKLMRCIWICVTSTKVVRGMLLSYYGTQKSPWQLESTCAHNCTRTHYEFNYVYVHWRLIDPTVPIAVRFRFPGQHSTDHSTALQSRSGFQALAVQRSSMRSRKWRRREDEASCCPLPMTRHSDLCSRTIIICEVAKAGRNRSKLIQLGRKVSNLKGA